MFTKRDLLNGMEVLVRSGGVRWVLNNALVSSTFMIRSNLADYRDDLTSSIASDFDIMEVHNHDGTLLFKREETTELSVKEIAERLGIPADKLRIKE